MNYRANRMQRVYSLLRCSLDSHTSLDGCKVNHKFSISENFSKKFRKKVFRFGKLSLPLHQNRMQNEEFTDT